jgi:hypothetical protein
MIRATNVRAPNVKFAERRNDEVRRISLPRTRVNRLSSDAPGSYGFCMTRNFLRWTFGALEHYVSLGTVFCNALMVETLP